MLTFCILISSYFQHSICEVKAFFQLPNGNIDMKTMAFETLQNVAKISQAGLIYAIQQHTVRCRSSYRIRISNLADFNELGPIVPN